jgi:predicted nuclease of predicted toxin-antitoxin system
MRFLVDECTGPSVASWLRERNHDVFSVFDKARGMDDDGIMTKALDEDRILITNDKGFGDKIYRDGRLHRGVILLRLEDERPASKIRVLSRLLEKYSSRMRDSFLVVTERQVRFAKTDQPTGPQPGKGVL